MGGSGALGEEVARGNILIRSVWLSRTTGRHPNFF
jgi:hypothetical protein